MPTEADALAADLKRNADDIRRCVDSAQSPDEVKYFIGHKLQPQLGRIFDRACELGLIEHRPIRDMADFERAVLVICDSLADGGAPTAEVKTDADPPTVKYPNGLSGPNYESIYSDQLHRGLWVSTAIPWLRNKYCRRFPSRGIDERDAVGDSQQGRLLGKDGRPLTNETPNPRIPARIVDFLAPERLLALRRFNARDDIAGCLVLADAIENSSQSSVSSTVIDSAADDAIPLRARKAWEQYCQAAGVLDDPKPNDRDVFDQLVRVAKLSGEAGELPNFATWSRYVREHRKLTNAQKNNSRHGRTGRSVQRSSQV